MFALTPGNFDPLSGSLREPPLPRSTGRMGAKLAAGASSPLTQWVRGAERSEAERGLFKTTTLSSTRER
jgi:hypothetical protein